MASSNPSICRHGGDSQVSCILSEIFFAIPWWLNLPICSKNLAPQTTPPSSSSLTSNTGATEWVTFFEMGLPWFWQYLDHLLLRRKPIQSLVLILDTVSELTAAPNLLPRDAQISKPKWSSSSLVAHTKISWTITRHSNLHPPKLKHASNIYSQSVQRVTPSQKLSLKKSRLTATTTFALPSFTILSTPQNKPHLLTWTGSLGASPTIHLQVVSLYSHMSIVQEPRWNPT